ncbi:pyridoxal phosphate-dependent transferase [Cokeromyces recurvatus]|uniref:pyridoxal phosphate-dependent transferase n=1 Tax=Cokeromyces recurvatus TaxID=90255 RepID=UPI00221E90B0|nr:pyridoxal phosphate-dependent transferase [Cokeromyces recurvatus]KAI7899343.1 pyridoxal phosphate-dependent transferase [Cokeromyces recurvatus]
MVYTENNINTVWDSKTQTFHGGQEHRFIDNFVEDFSVTTNYLGTPHKALEAAKEAIYDIHHYPAANQEPAKSCLAKFLWGSDYAKYNGRLLMGNGASELIDLVVRKALLMFTREGIQLPTWKGSPWNVQYREYQRSAETNGFKILDPSNPEKVDMICIVNPCNPTGDYFPIEPLKEWIKNNVKPGGCVIVGKCVLKKERKKKKERKNVLIEWLLDESMQPWHSPDFRNDSLISQHEFIREMYETEAISIHVMHSWTKIWSCTGLRIGSVICPTVEHCEALRKIQVPWSVNGPALKFVEKVVEDQDYLNETWKNTGRMRAYLIDQLKSLGFDEWEYHGEPFLSWVWLDMKNEEKAARAVELARKAGVPVRSGKPGYQCNSFIRVAVRKEDKVQVLINAWKSL